MGILRGTRCYTIGPMEFLNGEDWRNIVKKALKPKGITVFDPYHHPFKDCYEENETVRIRLDSLRKERKFEELHQQVKIIRAEDLRTVDISDWYIAQISPKTPTFGSMEELTTVARQMKPVLIWCVGGREFCPLWLWGMFKPEYFFDDLDSVLCYVSKIDDGLVKIDYKRWKILKEEHHECAR